MNAVADLAIDDGILLVFEHDATFTFRAMQCNAESSSAERQDELVTTESDREKHVFIRTTAMKLDSRE